jgi:hypothetical protein
MADICMCTGNCPVSEYCYRYMATPNPYGQTYSNLEDVCIPNGYSELIPYRNSIKQDDEKTIYTLEEFVLDRINKKNNATD